MSYIIRQITPWETGQMVPLAKAFHAEAGITSVFSAKALLDSISAREVFKAGMYQGEELVGVIVGVVTPQFMTTARIAQELMWYVKPEHRGAGNPFGLLKFFQAWAEGEGATDIILASLGEDTNKVAALYKKMGYKLIETHFIKHLA